MLSRAPKIIRYYRKPSYSQIRTSWEVKEKCKCQTKMAIKFIRKYLKI